MINFFFLTKHVSMLTNEYFSIFLMLVMSILLAIIILIFSYLLAFQKPEPEKLSSYECGFEPYEDARQQFEIQFYLIAILFIVFDLEIIFVYPWCVSLNLLNITGFWSMVDFIFELSIGFVYIWLTGALNWD